MQTRRAVSDPARAELTNRYRARASAEASLVAYLKGLVDGLGIPPETIAGFDDQTGELILDEPEPMDEPSSGGG